MRYVRKDKMNTQGVMLDLYPEKSQPWLDPADEETEQQENEDFQQKSAVEVLNKYRN